MSCWEHHEQERHGLHLSHCGIRTPTRGKHDRLPVTNLRQQRQSADWARPRMANQAALIRSNKSNGTSRHRQQTWPAITVRSMSSTSFFAKTELVAKPPIGLRDKLHSAALGYS